MKVQLVINFFSLTTFLDNANGYQYRTRTYHFDGMERGNMKTMNKCAAVAVFLRGKNEKFQTAIIE
jgi:hypothetical protein